MAQKTDEQLQTDRATIENETTAGANTASRVGNHFEDIIDSKVSVLDDETIAGVKTFSSDPIIPDEAYDATAWNGSLEPPTKNAVRDKIETVDPIGIQDMFVPAAAFWPRNTSGCAPLAQSEIATSLFNIQTLDFDQTTQEFAQVQIVLPRKWNIGTITAEVYWTASAGSGGVVFGLSGCAYANDDALTTAFGTEQTMTDTLIATNDLHITPTSAAITLANTPANVDFIALQLSRNPSDGSDTLTGDAKVLGVMLHITVNAAKDA